MLTAVGPFSERKGCETCCRAFNQLTEQFAIIEEIPTDDLGDAEDVLPVRYGVQYVALKMCSELNYFLRMGRGTEPSSATTKCQEIFMMAIRTPNACEALMQIPTFQKFPDYMGNYRPIKTISLGE